MLCSFILKMQILFWEAASDVHLGHLHYCINYAMIIEIWSDLKNEMLL